MFVPIFLTLTALTPVLACPDHLLHPRQDTPRLHARQTNTTPPAEPPAVRDWTYNLPNNWHTLNPLYTTCQTGSHQSPINLLTSTGPSTVQTPTFANYTTVTGDWTNWGFGLSYNLYHPEDDYTTLPSLSWDDEIAYLRGWHTHAPSDHPVDGQHAHLEIHLVHVNTEGLETAVVGIRVNPGGSDNPFFTQLPEPVGYENPEPVPDVEVDMGLVLESVGGFEDFWTYEGSLTTPPCREGLRWFVARPEAGIGNEELQAVLGVSTYSARERQAVWEQGVNEE